MEERNKMGNGIADVRKDSRYIFLIPLWRNREAPDPAVHRGEGRRPSKQDLIGHHVDAPQRMSHGHAGVRGDIPEQPLRGCLLLQQALGWHTVRTCLNFAGFLESSSACFTMSMVLRIFMRSTTSSTSRWTLNGRYEREVSQTSAHSRA